MSYEKVGSRYVQFLGSHDLLDVAWIAVEHEDQGFIVEVGHLALQGCNIADGVAFGQCETRNCRTRRLVVPEGVDLG